MGVQLPYNENAEKVVLGAALLSERSAGYVMTSVIDEHFFVKRHKIIFEAMRHLFDSRKPIDTTTLVDELLNTNKFTPQNGSGETSSSIIGNIVFKSKIHCSKRIFSPTILI